MPALALLALAVVPVAADAADPTPDLMVTAVSPPSQIAPGKPFGLQWDVRNAGPANAAGVPYVVVLSSVEGISVSDRVLHNDTFNQDAGADSRTITVQVMMPADVPTGSYFIGVIIDPEGLVIEGNEQNNAGVSERVQIASTDLSVLTTSLPPAELGSHFCVRLDAAGGNGTFTWTVQQTSQLPPGLSLEPVTVGGGAPLATTLCGRPSAVGTFDFALQVDSGGKQARHAYKLVVSESQIALRITSTQLPVALFQSVYHSNVIAIGGTPPYSWSLGAGRLPAGVFLRSDGILLGAAEEDGRFSFTVKVRDAVGAETEQALDLVVSSPSRLTCVTRSLDPRQVGEAFVGNLVAAGGSRPYTWVSNSTRRLAGGIGEASVVLQEPSPPGLALDRSGQISGEALEIGSYLWTVDVSDASQGSERCTVLVEVGVDHGLTISTRSLPNAIAGFSYLAKLSATGATGTLSWKVMEGSRLPAGLELGPSGLMEGIPNIEQLEGAPSRDFPFLVEVRDSQNRVGIAALSVRVLETQPEEVKPPSTTDDEGGGCQAAGGPTTLLAGAAVVGFALLRRRRAAS